jgi:tetratricopeptide (TPR) repeat protein
VTDADGPESQIVQNVTVVSGFAYGVIGADVHVFANGLPLYLLANWQPEQPQSPGWLREMPSRMLNARRAVVAFTGREGELAELRRWRDSGSELAVRWLHSPGGQGKTRLAARLAAESASAGWKVVTAFHGPDADRPEPGSQDMRLADASGLLMIVDYADRWRLTNLTWLLKNALLHQTGVPTRVLMVARSADSWPAVRGILDTYQADNSSQHLPGLGQQSGERRDMFTAARNSFAALYQLSGADMVGPPGSLDDPEFGLTLAVHMAALVAVDARATGQRPPPDMAGLTVYLLDREQLHWARLYADGTAAQAVDTTYRTSPQVMNQTVFTAALTGTVSPTVGTALLENLRLSDPEQILQDHAVCYPSPDPGQISVLEPLYPDRLAEDFLALTMPGHLADYPAQAWAAPTATTLLDRRGDRRAPAAWTPRAITFLASAAHRWPHLGQGYLYPLLRRDPQLAIDAGSAALSAIANLPDITMAVLEAIETRLPHGPHVDLDVGVAVLYEHLAKHRLTSRNPAARSRTLRRLAIALTRAGMYQQALAPAQEAVDLKRRLAQANPSLHRYNLASALEDLAIILSNLGRPEEALAATQEAMEIRQRLVHVDPVAQAGQPPTPTEPTSHDTGNAASLEDLGTWWSKQVLKVKGLVWEATAEAEDYWRLRTRPNRGAEIRQLLAMGEPDGQQAALSTSLTQQARTLWEAGRPEESLPLAQEAVNIRRRLSLAEPYGQGVGLAVSLMNLGITLSDLVGREQEALAATEEAVEIWRRMAQASPAAHEPMLAASLTPMATLLGELGRSDEALAAVEEAVEIGRRMARANPAAHEPMLAASLGIMGASLDEAGRQEEALAATGEAVEIWRRLARANQTASGPGLAASLTPMATLLGELGRSDEALAAAEEAVEIRRRLARADAATYGPDLAVSLGVLGTQLLDLGRSAEALAATTEAIELSPEFPEAVGTRGRTYRALGRYEDAVTDLTRAIEFDPELAWVIAERGETYRLMGRHEDAVTDLTRAIELDPESAEVIGTRGQVYRAVGRHDDAIADLTRAIELDPELAWAIAERGETYRLMDRHDAAIADLTRAIELDPEYAWALGTRGQVYRDMGRYDDAVADLTRAIELDPELA